MRKYLAQCVALFLWLFWSSIALAQTILPPPAPVTVLTPAVVIVTLLAVLAGYIAQAVNTGSLFGVVTVPQTWLPYLTLVGSFLAAAVMSLQGAAVVTSVSWFNALLSGLLALGGTSIGVVAHQHVDQPRVTKLRLLTSVPPVPPAKAA
jgi:hypothetical protein